MTSTLPFHSLAQLCADKGIKQAVISPGSRNAALTIAFTSNKAITCKSVSDERSAGFIAMGMALASGLPTVLICTSGTAALNYGPAVAEAYFRNIPLIILTADRPPEWIHQHDGQTIFQANCFGKHVLKFYEWLPDHSPESIQHACRINNEGINLAIDKRGPVHFNIPIREPFYPSVKELDYEKWQNVKTFKPQHSIQDSFISDFLNEVNNSISRLLVVGQQDQIEDNNTIKHFAKKFGFTIVSDCISNYGEGVLCHDIFMRKDDLELQPDLLLTIGESNISKPLKLFLRNHKVKSHWHIGLGEELIDPFVSITHKLLIDPIKLFIELTKIEFKATLTSSRWEVLDKNTSMLLDGFWRDETIFSDISVVKQFLAGMSKGSVLHLGNSMSVRYVNALQKYLPQDTHVLCNRGTSGIDGILSTAVGYAINTKKMVYCIIGDVSFQYDKNALWNNLVPDNLKILILNNQGGVIFQMIQGPTKQDSFDEFFRTKQVNKADLIALEYGVSYSSAANQDTLGSTLQLFQEQPGPSILEVFTDPDESENRYKAMLNIC